MIKKHHRDSAAGLDKRRRNMTVGSLRKTYGAGFAEGYHRDVKLSTVLESTGAGSLDEYVEHYQRAKALAKATGTSALSNTIIAHPRMSSVEAAPGVTSGFTLAQCAG